MNKTDLISCLKYVDDKVYLDNVVSKRTGRRFNYFDSRTKIIDHVPHVFPVGISNTLVYICCPYCHEFHSHGLGADGNSYGHRIAHCACEGILMKNNEGYIIEKPLK